MDARRLRDARAWGECSWNGSAATDARASVQADCCERVGEGPTDLGRERRDADDGPRRLTPLHRRSSTWATSSTRRIALEGLTTRQRSPRSESRLWVPSRSERPQL